MSKLLFDQFLPRAQCAVGAIATLSLLERTLGKSQQLSQVSTFSTWDQVTKFGEELNIRTDAGNPVEAFRYLLTKGQNRGDSTSVSFKAADGPVEAVSRLIGAIADHYYSTNRVLGRLLADPGHLQPAEKSALEHVSKFKADDWFSGALKRSEARRRSRKSRALDINFRAFVKELEAATAGLNHPDFPTLDLVSEPTLACEFHGLAAEESLKRDRSGLFAVVREARGWFVESEREQDTNIVVRDLLWLEDLDKLSSGGESVAGIYYSVYDPYVFRVRASGDVPRSQATRNVVVTTKGEGLDAQKLSLELVFPIPTRTEPLQIRQGIMSGTGRSPDQLGAWKALLISPDWEDRHRLEALISQFSKDQALLDSLQDVLSSGGYCGVLHSKAISKDTGAKRENFRQLVQEYSTAFSIDDALGGYLRTEIENAIREKLEAAIDDPDEPTARAAGVISDEKIQKYVTELLNRFDKILDRRWHLVVPMQILTFLSSQSQIEEALGGPPKVKKMILSLLERFAETRLS